MQNLLAVGLGGFVGAIARYTLGGFVDSRLNARFPWGTLPVNVLGCLLIGAILGWMSTREASSRTAELFLVTGILGSLTTFSTFGHDTVELLRQDALGPAAGNIALNVIVGLTAVALGLASTRGWN